MHKATMAYIQTGVTTQGQGEILLMLYDGALNFLTSAKVRLAANDMAGKGNYISKALNVIDELRGSLNMEKGGSIAENLRNLYTFCYNRLISANIKKSPEMIDEVIKVLAGLRSAFASIVDLPEAREAAAQTASMQANKAVTQNRTVVAPTSGTAASQGPMAPGASAKRRNIYTQNMQLHSNPAVSGKEPAMEENTAEIPAIEESPVIQAEQKEETPPLVETHVATSDKESESSMETTLPPPPVSKFGAGRLAMNRYQKFS